MLLYDTIMEAKSTVGEALCCGTNFVMRRRALEDAGGWDERSISEDLMTSFLIRNEGWKSLYVRRPYVKGLGPLDISSYWKQQKRWASGNTTVVRLIWRALLRGKPKPAALKHSIGYLWSAGFYIAAMGLAGLAALPVLLLIASYLHAPHALQPVPGAQPKEWLFLSVYPFYAVVMLYPYVHMRMRGYPFRNLMMVQGLLAVTLPVYVVSVVKGLFTDQTFFEIASKKLSADMKARLLGPQAIVLLAALAAGSLLTHNILTQPHLYDFLQPLFFVRAGSAARGETRTGVTATGSNGLFAGTCRSG